LTLLINGHAIGPGHRPYVIAEMSGNHNGDLSRAYQLIEAAKAAGADAVKLQTYTADTITIDHDGPGFVIEGGLWDGRSLYELYQEASTPWEWHPALFAKARELEIDIFSSPFDPTAVDYLESLGCPAYKIASFELVDIPLIQKAARTGKPLIMSVGMANDAEIEEAVAAVRACGNAQIVLLHCVSAYPAPASDMNLAAIGRLAQRFGTASGLSDHSMGITVPVTAVALGASVIEKHFTLRRADGGPDSGFSLEAHELAEMVSACATAHQAIGTAEVRQCDSQEGNKVFRRSLYVTADIAAGTAITEAHVRSIRPGFGLAPKHLPAVLGKTAARDLKKGEPFDWSMIVSA